MGIYDKIAVPLLNTERAELDKFKSSFCCQVRNYGVLYFLETFPKFGGSLYAFLANCIFSTLCFQLMMCGCVQGLSKRKRKIGERVGYVVFALVCVCTIALGAACWGLAAEKHKRQTLVVNALKIFFSAKIGSWIGTTVFNVFVFVVLFQVQRPKDASSPYAWLDPPRDLDAVDTRNALVKAVNPRFHVLAVEYLDAFGSME